MTTPARPDGALDTADPPVLVAILIAARRTGDSLLETVARRELEQRHGISIRFARESDPGAPPGGKPRGGGHAACSQRGELAEVPSE
jgi:hypothetical protein